MILVPDKIINRAYENSIICPGTIRFKVIEMRPITPQLIIETLRLAKSNPILSPPMVERALMVSPSRSKEVLRQMEDMNLLTYREEGYQLSAIGERLFQSAIRGDMGEVHRLLLEYPLYQVVYRRLERSSLTLDEMSEHTGKSRVAIDVLLRLVRWTHLNLVKNPRTGRYYLASDTTPSTEEFQRALFEVYKELSSPSIFGMKKLYVKITRIKERVCERLGINKNVFDKLFRKTSMEMRDIIELASAPDIAVDGNPFTLDSKKNYYYLRIEGAKL